MWKKRTKSYAVEITYPRVSIYKRMEIKYGVCFCVARGQQQESYCYCWCWCYWCYCRCCTKKKPGWKTTHITIYHLQCESAVRMFNDWKLSNSPNTHVNEYYVLLWRLVIGKCVRYIIYGSLFLRKNVFIQAIIVLSLFWICTYSVADIDIFIVMWKHFSLNVVYVRCTTKNQVICIVII